MFTVVLAGKSKPTSSQTLKRSLGARKHMVRDFVEYMKDKHGSLVNGFGLARKSSVGEANVDTYASDESVPQEVLEEVLDLRDPNNIRGRASSSYTNDRR